MIYLLLSLVVIVLADVSLFSIFTLAVTGLLYLFGVMVAPGILVAAIIFYAAWKVIVWSVLIFKNKEAILNGIKK